MRNIVLTISYDGTRFFGWQKTTTGPSIEEELEKGLQTFLQHPLVLQAASRTDRGVHAHRQIINFFTERSFSLKEMLFKINRLLPKDIRVTDIQEKNEQFHPTLQAKAKTYHYRITTATHQSPFIRRFSWHFPYTLDYDLMKKASELLIGDHNFQSFSSKKTSNPFCSISSIKIETISFEESLIKITGNRFLYKMVRILTGTLAYIGSGKISLESLKTIMSSKRREAAPVTAEARGLTLFQINY